jgi:hypothetical protein
MAATTSTASLAASRADESLWVVKVPRFLMEHLQSCAGTGSSLGDVTREAAPESTSAAASSSSRGAPPAAPYKLTLSEAGLPEGLPREYDFRFSAPPPATYVFSRGGAPSDGPCHAPRHEGRVTARGELRPREISGAYKRLLKERGDAADVRTPAHRTPAHRTRAHRTRARRPQMSRADTVAV